MSVRPECLQTSEGALLSISIAVQPRDLESLLEGLAMLRFPVNPLIYHDAATVTRLADGREEYQAVVLVEFPAYTSWVEDVRQVVAGCGLDPVCVETTSMLEEVQGDGGKAAAMPGASRYRVRRAGRH
jgi:hypothetical protein